jgi:hypothetical protein
MRWDSLSRRERVGVRGYGLSNALTLTRRISAFTRVFNALCADLSQWER